MNNSWENLVALKRITWFLSDNTLTFWVNRCCCFGKQLHCLNGFVWVEQRTLEFVCIRVSEYWCGVFVLYFVFVCFLPSIIGPNVYEFQISLILLHIQHTHLRPIKFYNWMKVSWINCIFFFFFVFFFGRNIHSYFIRFAHTERFERICAVRYFAHAFSLLSLKIFA